MFRVPVLLPLLFLTAALFAQAPTQIFPVTNTNDDGAGSLRSAIDEANALCGDLDACTIVFRIPATGPWHTIRPERPLPAVRAARLVVDGTSQTAFGGDTNPDGPEIELSGVRLLEGSGLEFATACGASIRGLAINGFPANGIVAGLRPCAQSSFPMGRIEFNYIGTDPTGTVAVPNFRGIWAVTPPALNFHWFISDNVISGNTASGIFVGSGPQDIRRNTIGLNAKRNAPLGNGASGVAVLAAGSGTDIDDNYIGFNRHFGVALGQGTQKVAMTGNSFQGNHQLAIDYNMDGVSPTGVVSIPTITSVRYEDGKTIIEAESNSDLAIFPRMNFYANDAPDPSGYGEGQYALGWVHARSDDRTKFTFVHPGDLRGKWVTATATKVNYYGFARKPGISTNGEWQGFIMTTSEFSRAVEVK
jgi:hypothetical protein